jgi:hypothetical protein
VNDENIIEALDQCIIKLERVYDETKNSDIYQLFE